MERSNFFHSFLPLSIVGIDFPKNGAKWQRVISFCSERSGDSKKLSMIYFWRIVVVVFSFCMITLQEDLSKGKSSYVTLIVCAFHFRKVFLKINKVW